MVCCKSTRHWLTAVPKQLHTDYSWVCRRPAFVFQMPDTVIAYITHGNDDRPNISSASSLHGAKRRGSFCVYFSNPLCVKHQRVSVFRDIPLHASAANTEMAAVAYE